MLSCVHWSLNGWYICLGCGVAESEAALCGRRRQREDDMGTGRYRDPPRIWYVKIRPLLLGVLYFLVSHGICYYSFFRCWLPLTLSLTFVLRSSCCLTLVNQTGTSPWICRGSSRPKRLSPVCAGRFCSTCCGRSLCARMRFPSARYVRYEVESGCCFFCHLSCCGAALNSGCVTLL